MDKIYLDNASTTRVTEEVAQSMLPYMVEKYGNPSSIHAMGRESHKALEESRKIIAEKIGAHPSEIIFTSGGTESNNLALKGVAYANKDRGKHIITTKIEHPSILNSLKWLEKQGYDVTYLGVDKEGFINPDDLKKAIRKDTILISIVHANNEVGTIQDLKTLGKIAKEHGVPLHTDACQSFTKTKIDVKEQELSLVTVNSHKIHGPKGVGALYVKAGTKIEPTEHGGGHESRMRSGTENIPAIVGFAKAAQLTGEKQIAKMTKLRDRLIEKAIAEIPNTILNGPKENRLCNNANIRFQGIEGESLLLRLDAKGIMCSTASACSSKSLQPSHVLTAMGIPPEEAHSSLRFSNSIETEEVEVDYLIECLKEEVQKLRAISPTAR